MWQRFWRIIAAKWHWRFGGGRVMWAAEDVPAAEQQGTPLVYVTEYGHLRFSADMLSGAERETA